MTDPNSDVPASSAQPQQPQPGEAPSAEHPVVADAAAGAAPAAAGHHVPAGQTSHHHAPGQYAHHSSQHMQPGQPVYDGPPPPDFDGDIVPFAAPPKERNSTRFTLALVGGILGAVLLCGGVIFAVVTMTFQLESAVRDEVVAVTDQFLEDIEQQRYQAAYDSLCNAKRDMADQRVYEQEWQGWDTSGWMTDIDRVEQTMAGDLILPVEFADGEEWNFEISFDGGDNLLDIQVCDWGRA